MTPEEVEAIVASTPARFQALFWFMFGTGARVGEATGLTLDRLDLLRKTVRIDSQLAPDRPGVLVPPKTSSSVRTLPLSSTVVEVLAAHLAQFPADGEGFVHRRARPSHRATPCRAAVECGGGERRGHWPDDRRPPLFASLLIASNASVKVVQRMLGHRSARTTLDVYSHMWGDGEDVTRSAVDAVFGAGADHTRTSLGAHRL